MFTSGWSDREARKLSGATGERSDKLHDQRGARMPGQRRAGQLVIYMDLTKTTCSLLYL